MLEFARLTEIVVRLTRLLAAGERIHSNELRDEGWRS